MLKRGTERQRERRKRERERDGKTRERGKSGERKRHGCFRRPPRSPRAYLTAD